MKKPSRATKLTLILIVTASLGALTVLTPLTYAQNNTNSPTANPSESQQQQLVEAQRKYYEAQAAKLNDERSTWQKIVNLGAFLAAFVAILSLVLNFSSTLRMQRDTQFYEALKRFGAQDSPTVRSSAAGLLAKLSNQRGIIFRWQRPNFDIALDQLMAGTVLEDNPVCLTSIKDALRQLTAYSPLRVLEKIRSANLEAQYDMVEALAAFLATKGLDIETALANEKHWGDAAVQTPYDAEVLYSLVRRHEEGFRREHKSASQEYGSMDQAKKPDHVLAAQKALRLAGARLCLNVEIFDIGSIASRFRQILRVVKVNLRDSYKKGFRWEGSTTEHLVKIFLVQAVLEGVKLRETNFQGSQLNGSFIFSADLQGAHFDGADLRGTSFLQTNLQNASFCGAHLQGASVHRANLKDAFLTEAQLYLMKIDETTNLEDCNWWSANFEGDKGIDTDLLEELFRRYGDKVPKSEHIDIDWTTKDYKAIRRAFRPGWAKLHPSVRRFMEEKRTQESQQS